jgi:hypothetical protein
MSTAQPVQVLTGPARTLRTRDQPRPTAQVGKLIIWVEYAEANALMTERRKASIPVPLLAGVRRHPQR